MSSPSKGFWTKALFGCTGSDLPPEVVLLVRLIAIAWLVTGHALLFPRRSVPFFEFLAPLADSPLVGTAALALGAVCAVELVVGKAVRVSALTLGALIFLTTLLSRTFFSNNRLFAAALLVLAGLEAAKGPPRLLRAQVVVLYLCAGLDKLLDADWRSGAFVRSFVRGLASHGHLWSPGQGATSAYLPAEAVDALLVRNPSLTVVASWGTLLVELAIGFALLAGRRQAGIALGLVFHAGLLLYTRSPLGMFFYAAAASYFAFVELPSKIDVRAGPRLHRVIDWVDADCRCRVEPGPRLSMTIAGETRGGASALCALLVRLPAFYVLLAVVFSGPWFTPWLLLFFTPLVFGFRPFALPEQRPEIRDVPS